MSAHPRGGFTLIELLVVLAILVALSTVALRSVDGLQDRARYDATRQRLEDIEAALFGPHSGLPGEAHAGGLLADTGRFLDASIADPTQRLADLVRIPSGVQANNLLPSSDPDVSLAVGWRGPYIRTTPGAGGSEVIEDGWGNAIGAVFDAGTSRWSLVSAGQDGVFGSGTGYDADLAIELPVDAGTATLAGTVSLPAPLAAGHTLDVVLYTPNPSTGALLELHFTSTDALDSTIPYSFSGATSATPGPRIVRAYERDASMATVGRSKVVAIDLLHGAQTLDLGIGP